MSELEQIMIQQRLIVIDYYMRVLGMGFLAALYLEANPLITEPEEDMPHAQCRCVGRFDHE